MLVVVLVVCVALRCFAIRQAEEHLEEQREDGVISEMEIKVTHRKHLGAAPHSDDDSPHGGVKSPGGSSSSSKTSNHGLKKKKRAAVCITGMVTQAFPAVLSSWRASPLLKLVIALHST